MIREAGETDVREIAELEDGTQIRHVTEWVETEPSWTDSAWVDSEEKIRIIPPEGDPIDIEGGRGHGYYPAKWRERVITQLIDRVDEFTVTDDQNAVPVNIINEGKPAIVSYVYAIHGWSYGEIHDALDVNGGTIRQYLIHVANDNR